MHLKCCKSSVRDSVLCFLYGFWVHNDKFLYRCLYIITSEAQDSTDAHKSQIDSKKQKKKTSQTKYWIMLFIRFFMSCARWKKNSFSFSLVTHFESDLCICLCVCVCACANYGELFLLGKEKAQPRCLVYSWLVLALNLNENQLHKKLYLRSGSTCICINQSQEKMYVYIYMLDERNNLNACINWTWNFVCQYAAGRNL